ncbi:MAG: transglutaminase-like domain-containing protein [Gammaproteobacteria bacterium]
MIDTQQVKQYLSSPLPEPPLDLTVRVGCVVSYQAERRAPILLLLKPHLDLRQGILEEQLTFGPGLSTERLVDSHGNVVYRMILVLGSNEIRHDAIFSVPSRRDNDGLPTAPVPIERLPVEVLRYTLPSRYCDSDKLMNFAWQQFGHLPHGVARVQATCDWVHANIEYRYGWGNPTISAADVLAQGYGVCRDFAHLVVALCRAFNLPTRYVSGHLPDIGVMDRYNRLFCGRLSRSHAVSGAAAEPGVAPSPRDLAPRCPPEVQARPAFL